MAHQWLARSTGGNVHSMLGVIGECLIDLVGSVDGHTYTAHPGGSPLNIAVGLARLEQDTTLLARLADDAFGRVLRAHAADNGVDLHAAVPADEPSTAAIVSLDEQGRASYDFYVAGTADFCWRPEELAVLPAKLTLLHSGSLASWMPPGSDVIADVCERLRRTDAVILSYDPNVRPRLMGPHTSAVAKVERSVANSHVVKASDEDIAWLYPDTDPTEVAQRWLTLGAALVVVTRGPHGATGYLPDGQQVQQPGRAVRLIDTVGAGDAFMSGLLGALSDVGVSTPSDLALVQQPSILTSVLEQAVLVSALTCEQAGANPPTRSAVRAASQ